MTKVSLEMSTSRRFGPSVTVEKSALLGYAAYLRTEGVDWHDGGHIGVVAAREFAHALLVAIGDEEAPLQPGEFVRSYRTGRLYRLVKPAPEVGENHWITERLGDLGQIIRRDLNLTPGKAAGGQPLYRRVEVKVTKAAETWTVIDDEAPE